jgi:hypothetical protein
LTEACARLAITPRQLRYRIKEGSVKAVKVEGRWVIDEADLPRTPTRDRKEIERAADLSQVLSDALAKRRARRRYSVQDLEVFVALVAVAQDLHRRNPDHPAWPHLTAAATTISRAVHAFDRKAKAAAFQAARLAVADAVAWLNLVPVGGDDGALDEVLEASVLPGLGGLLRRPEEEHA